MAQGKKRLGKKHRQASTRPKKGRAPRATPTTGAVDPRKRKVLSTKRAAADGDSRRCAGPDAEEYTATVEAGAAGGWNRGASDAAVGECGRARADRRRRLA